MHSFKNFWSTFWTTCTQLADQYNHFKKTIFSNSKQKLKLSFMQTTSASGVVTTITPSQITLDKVSNNGEFQKKGTLTAQIRQTVETLSLYPSKKTASNMQDNFFSNDEFGFGTQDFKSVENRVAWILVPEGISVAEVQARIEKANANGACIYKALSCRPILDENQIYAINAKLRTLDDFAATQAVRFPENPATIADGTAGKLVLDKAGRVQYRRTFFWGSPKADVDARHIDTPYVSALLQAELSGASVMANQTI